MNALLPGITVDIDTIIHALDSRVKLLSAILLSWSLFLFPHYAQMIFFISFIFILFKIARVNFYNIFQTVKIIFPVILILGFVSIFFTQGKALFTSPKLSFYNITLGSVIITQEGLLALIPQTYALVFSVIIAGFFSYTTSSIALSQAFEWFFAPLQIIKIPVRDISMAITIAFRFVPIFIDEIDIITKAQSARGINFNKGNSIQKLFALIPLFVPLFVQAVIRAEELALAMQVRGFTSGQKRKLNRLKPLRFSLKDLIAIFILISYFLLQYFLGILLV